MTLSEFNGTTPISTAEITLFEVTTGPRHFAATVYLHEMTSLDSFTIKVFVFDSSSGTQRLYDEFTYFGVQAEPAIFIPFLPTTQYKVTGQKGETPTRNFTWTRFED